MLYSACYVIAYRANAQHSYVVAVVQFTSGTHLYLLQWASPVLQLAATTWIAYHERTLVRQLGGVHQSSQLVLIQWRADGHVWYGAQGSQVKGTMVCGTILAHQSRAVKAEHHVQVQQSHVVYDIVECTLCKGAVDIAEGQQSVFGHTAAECHGVSLGYTHIKRAFGHLFHHDVHRAAAGHRRCYTHNPRVLLSQFQQRVSEYILVFLWLGGVVVHQALTRIGVKLARCVPYRHILLGRCIAMSLLGVQVQQFGAGHILQLTQYAHQFLHVVSVKRSEVLYVHTVKNVLLVADGALHGVAQSYQPLLAVVGHHTVVFQPAHRSKLNGVIRLVGAQVQQILLHAAHTAVDTHVVIVQYDQQVVRAARNVVQSLKSQSAAQCTVANHSHHMAVVLALQFSCYGHTQGCRYRVAGVSAGKGVVLALFGRWERLDTAQLTVGAESVFTASQNLMSVSLVSHVPNYSVFGGVIYVMKCNRNFGHTQTRG